MGGCIHGCRTQCCRTLSVQLPTFRHNDVLMCQETQKDVPGSMDVSVCFQATTGATEDLLPSQFLADTSASSTGLGGVVLVHDLHPAVGVLPGLVQQAPRMHASDNSAAATGAAVGSGEAAVGNRGQQTEEEKGGEGASPPFASTPSSLPVSSGPPAPASLTTSPPINSRRG
ncbi:hypothetical protein QOT17_025532 [Balamuthia mandrillaris]